VEGSRRERRAQRRWRREALRRLEELDRVDREQGLGAMPLGTDVGGSGRHRRRGRRAPGTRRSTGPVLPGLLISGIIAGLVMLHDPGMTGYRFRQLMERVRGDDGGSFAFVVKNAQGDPVGWNHCKPIHYVVNPEGAPAGWEDIIRGGVATVTQASAFQFQYDGTSIERSFDGRVGDASHPPPVLIAWAGSDEVAELAGSTAGIGGSTPAQVHGRVQFVTGMVVLDTAAYAEMEAQSDHLAEQLILAHELGHVLGLDHVDDIGELMNAEYVGQDGFGPGDREGLERLHDLPCR
jgi:hypothetical protein